MVSGRGTDTSSMPQAASSMEPNRNSFGIFYFRLSIKGFAGKDASGMHLKHARYTWKRQNNDVERMGFVSWWKVFSIPPLNKEICSAGPIAAACFHCKSLATSWPIMDSPRESSLIRFSVSHKCQQGSAELTQKQMSWFQIKSAHNGWSLSHLGRISVAFVSKFTRLEMQLLIREKTTCGWSISRMTSQKYKQQRHQYTLLLTKRAFLSPGIKTDMTNMMPTVDMRGGGGTQSRVAFTELLGTSRAHSDTALCRATWRRPEGQRCWHFLRCVSTRSARL